MYCWEYQQLFAKGHVLHAVGDVIIKLVLSSDTLTTTVNAQTANFIYESTLVAAYTMMHV